MGQRSTNRGTGKGMAVWQRLCFDPVEFKGVQGPCEAPECDMGHPGCKLAELWRRGLMARSSVCCNAGAVVQSTCGVSEEEANRRYRADIPTALEVTGKGCEEVSSVRRGRKRPAWG